MGNIRAKFVPLGFENQGNTEWFKGLIISEKIFFNSKLLYLNAFVGGIVPFLQNYFSLSVCFRIILEGCDMPNMGVKECFWETVPECFGLLLFL